MASEEVVLVDAKDTPIGREEKLRAHVTGKLHRAFSVFVMNSKGELMMQRRAETKYHSGGLWSNTCCGHPRPGIHIAAEAHRRLEEEMGFDCRLSEIVTFRYMVPVGNALIEHELDHVFAGQFNGRAHVDSSEVSAWEWVNLDDLAFDLYSHPARYTAWFSRALSHFFERSVLYWSAQQRENPDLRIALPKLVRHQCAPASSSASEPALPPGPLGAPSNPVIARLPELMEYRAQG